MFLTADELRSHGIYVSEARLSESDDQACAFCDRTAAPMRKHDTEALAEWAASPNSTDATGYLQANDKVDVRAPRRSTQPISQATTGCMVCDSQLAAVVAIPKHILVTLFPRLTTTQKQFVCHDLVYRACVRCRGSALSERYSGQDLVAIVLRVNFEGKRAPFEGSTAFGNANGIADLLDREVRQHAV